MQVATDPAAARDALEAARGAHRALPTHTSPPPWIGHFHAALFELFDGRLTTDAARRTRLASCLRFACVAPDGSRRAAEIAALRT